MKVTMSSLVIKDDKGLVSFMITIIMMLVITLIVIGFTQVSNRNRRESLDRQLSTQAFYAAESGVNEALKVLRTSPTAEQSSCDGVVFPAQSLSVNPSVKYTCVLVDPFVPDIITGLNAMSSTVFPFDTVDAGGNPVATTRLTFKWSQPQGGTTSTAGCPLGSGQFRSSLSYSCNYGLLRVDIVKAPFNFSGGAASLNALTSTFFLQPTRAGGGPASYSIGSSNAYIIPSPCVAATASCTASIPLSAGSQVANYNARLTMYYRDAETVTIDAFNGATSLDFKNAQASIDSTGKAIDVLRRIKVRARLNTPDPTLPPGAIQSQSSVCKRFTAAPGLYASFCP